MITCHRPRRPLSLSLSIFFFLALSESAPLKAVHLSRQKWPGGSVNQDSGRLSESYLIILHGLGEVQRLPSSLSVSLSLCLCLSLFASLLAPALVAPSVISRGILLGLDVRRASLGLVQEGANSG